MWSSKKKSSDPSDKPSISFPCKTIAFSATKTRAAAPPVNDACMCWPPQSVSYTSISCTLKKKHSPRTTALHIPVLQQKTKCTEWSCVFIISDQQIFHSRCGLEHTLVHTYTPALVCRQAADSCICTGQGDLPGECSASAEIPSPPT